MVPSDLGLWIDDETHERQFDKCFVSLYNSINHCLTQGAKPMSTSPAILDQRQVITRIDAIIHELEALRRQLQLAAHPKTTVPTGITEELFGAAGQGTRDEYDLNLDWARFAE
jgi:hypothetical protein